MRDILLQRLLKSKSDDTLEVEELIESYLLNVGKRNREESESFVSELLVQIMEQVEHIDREVLLSMIETKISSLGYTVDSAALEKLHAKGAEVAAGSVGAKFAFDKRDAAVIESMYRALTWMREDGTRDTQERLKSTIAEAMDGEIDIADLGATLREEFAGVVDGSERYFQDVSEHIIRQSQSLTRAYQFEKAGVQRVKVVAVIDSRTSVICLSLHGRIIDIGHIVKQADAITAATTIEEKKEVARWQSKPIFGELESNVGLPPYHFSCRSIVVAYFGQSAEVDGKKVNGSLLPGEKFKGKEVLFSHVDRFGHERVVTDKTLDHGGNPHDVSLKSIIAGLNTLEQMAINKTVDKRVVAFSKDKNLFFSFEDGEVITAFDSGRKEYFKDNAEIATISRFSVKKGKDEAV